MRKVILSTGSNYNYLSKINPYLHSIEKKSNFDLNILIFLDNDTITLKSDKIKVMRVLPSVVQSPNPNGCLQHGEFLRAEGFDEMVNDDDIIFFTDGDMWIQRNLTDEEFEWLRNFKDGDVYVGYNASPTDTLYDEGKKLGPTGELPDAFKVDLTKIKVYNTGVLAMNKGTWKRLNDEYHKLFPSINTHYRHYAKQQWLLSFIIGTMDFNIIEMGYDIHNHTHYPSPLGTKIDENGVVTYKDKVVLFKHKWY